VLEEGYLPEGVERRPGRGNQRQLRIEQAYWLAIVLKLRETGIKTESAASLADYAKRGLSKVGVTMGWDKNFQPFKGKLNTDKNWYVDIGDRVFFRIVTDAGPTQKRALHAFDWTLGNSTQPLPDVAPIAIIRIDLTRLAYILKA
jgi:hypothetical protein